jgi:heme-degrading monooxygenase HmoA
MAQGATTSKATYFCTATRIRVRNPLHLPAFVWASFAAGVAAKRTPGNVRTRLLGLPPFPIFSTLSVWESREAMAQFVRSPAHRTCMEKMPSWAAHGRFVTFTTETPRVGWRRAGRMLRDPDAVWTPKSQYRRPAV